MKIFRAPEKGQPYFAFHNPEDRTTFLQGYSPETGIGVSYNGTDWTVYTNTRVYSHCKVYFNKQKYKGIEISCTDHGIKISGSGYPMRQDQTVTAALKCIRIVGLPLSRFILVSDYCADPQSRRGYAALLAMTKGTYTAPRQSEDRTLDAAKLRFLEQQGTLVEARRQYEEAHLFHISYSAVSQVVQNLQDGVIKKFRTDTGLADSSQIGKTVSVPLRAGARRKFLTGTVVAVEKEWISVKFHQFSGTDEENSDSPENIAPTGELSERLNPEYGYMQEALRLLSWQESPNSSLLDILVNKTAAPYRSFEEYIPTPGKRINPSQREAIEKAINTEDILLVQGPPGTGKTTIITEMVEHFVKKKKFRVLICSKNNLAVDNVLEKCEGLRYENGGSVQCLRLGNQEKVLFSVQKALPRPLALSIQKAMVQRSAEAYERFVSAGNDAAQQLIRQKRGVGNICDTAARLLKRSETYAAACETFEKSLFSRLLFGKRKKLLEMLKDCRDGSCALAKQVLSLLYQQTDSLSAEECEHFTKTLGQLLAAEQHCSDALAAVPFRKRLIFGKQPTGIERDSAMLAKAETELTAKIGAIRSSYIGISAQGGANVRAAAKRLCGESCPSAAQAAQIYTDLGDRIQSLQARREVFSCVLDEWRGRLQSDESSLRTPLLRSVKVIGATCIGVNTTEDFRDVEYDVAIVDEAGQIPLQDLLVPLVKARKVILIGDHLQLPPGGETDFCSYIEENELLGLDEIDDPEERREFIRQLNREFSVSLFEQLFNSAAFPASKKVTLDTQFRMHPVIAQFISERFYGGRYRSGVTAEDRAMRIASFDRPMCFFDTSRIAGNGEERRNLSYQNPCEAMICARQLAPIILEAEKDDRWGLKRGGEYDIGVITAYKPQIDLIRRYLRRELEKALPPAEAAEIAEHLTVNTLDSFQGRDNRIIVYSFVRSNPRGDIGFLNEVRRLNVMMTRAKSLLIMIGDSQTLCRSNAKTVHDGTSAAGFFRALTDYCRQQGSFVSCDGKELR